MTKNKQLFITSTLIVLAFVSGHFIGATKGIPSDGMDHNAMISNTMSHASSSMNHTDHPHIQVAEGRVSPEIELDAIKDSKGGYNLHIITKNFSFTPQDAGKAPVQNTGHAHVFVNGAKIARAYGEWFYVGADALATGLNVITVSLNANEHSMWVAKNGDEIEASVEVDK